MIFHQEITRRSLVTNTLYSTATWPITQGTHILQCGPIVMDGTIILPIYWMFSTCRVNQELFSVVRKELPCIMLVYWYSMLGIGILCHNCFRGCKGTSKLADRTHFPNLWLLAGFFLIEINVCSNPSPYFRPLFQHEVFHVISTLNACSLCSEFTGWPWCMAIRSFLYHGTA